MRNDIHCPKRLVLSEYSLVLCFAYGGGGFEPPINLDVLRTLQDTKPFFKRKDGKGGCHVCGVHYRYGSVLRHTSGEHIMVGWECADKIVGLSDSDREGVLVELERLERKFTRRWRLRKFISESTPELRSALRNTRKVRIVRDIRSKLGQYGGLTSAQAALVLRIAREQEERKIKGEEIKVPAPEGRVTVRGEVVSIKPHESQFGTTFKMTVKVTAEGGVFLVWSTMPAAIRRTLKQGDQVEFSADLKRSNRDPGFAFGSRPTCGRILKTTEK